MQSVARLKDIPGIPDAYEEQNILDEFRDYAGEFAAALQGWAAIRDTAQNLTNNMLSAGQLTP
jgi:hypothetical protein